MKKNLTNNFFGIAMLAVVMLGIGSFPQNVYAFNTCPVRGCPYTDLVSVLPQLLQDLNNNKAYLVTSNITNADINGVVDNAIAKVQQAINAPPTDTPAWIALGNQAVVANDTAAASMQTLRERATPSRQTTLDEDIATCNAAGQNCPQSLRTRIAAAQAAITRSTAIASGNTPPSTKCKNGLGDIFDPICWARTISVVIGSLLISLGALFLALADMLFNWTVVNTILLFSTEIFDKVKGGISAGWTAMRDIANIVIIGMFTFIAISTILGIQEYAAKKLLARVLIIAVLINFSLLFTKLIIDVSNFTAAQFYASTVGANSVREARDMAAGRVAGTAPVTTTVTDSSLDSYRGIGISGAFIRFLGVTSVSNTFNNLYDIANDNKTGGWYVALAHGLLGALLLGGAGAVLFYGTYLLISRAVLFIFLMITASGAFATHLIPKVNESTYGLKGWWSSLLGNAALAPFLMIFLWITLQVSEKITPRAGSLGNLASPGVTGTDINLLFSYFIILGLLWGSFKLSSKWAGKVGGLNFTGSLLGSAAVAPFALGSRFLAAPVMRKVFGGNAAAKSMMLEGDIKNASKKAARIQDKTSPEYRKALDRITGMMKSKAQVDKLAHGSFNVANVKPVQAGLKALGVPSFLTGAAKSEGFADAAKTRADEAIKAAEKLALKNSDISKEIRDEIRAGLEHNPRYEEDLRRKREMLQNSRVMAEEARNTQAGKLESANKIHDEAKGAKEVGENKLNEVNRQREVEVPVLVKLRVDKGNADATVQQEEAKGNAMKNTDAGFQEQQEKIRLAKASADNIGTRVTDQQKLVDGLNDAAQAASAAVSEADGKMQQATKDIAKINDDVLKGDEKVKKAEADYNNAANEALEEEVERMVDNSLSLATDAATESASGLLTDANTTEWVRKAASKHFDKQGFRVREAVRQREAALKDFAGATPPPSASSEGTSGTAGSSAATK